MAKKSRIMKGFENKTISYNTFFVKSKKYQKVKINISNLLTKLCK